MLTGRKIARLVRRGMAGFAVLVGVNAAVAGGCAAGSGGDPDEGVGGATGTAAGNGGSGNVDFTSGSGKLVEEPPCNDTDPAGDQDKDGWSDDEGDCNDCTAQMNPGAIDYDGNGVDEDCNGTPDDNPTDCDDNIAVDTLEAMDAVRALDLCKMKSGDSYGVVKAEWHKVDGTDAPTSIEFHRGHGVLTDFGPNVKRRAGKRLLALSSGAARRPTDSDWQDPFGYDKGYISGAPAGYPKESEACPKLKTGTPHDSISLWIRLRTPTNAASIRFNVNMHTYEFPGYICSEFNDFVVAILTPIPAGQIDGNICFDMNGNPLSVNAGFLQVCTPQASNGKNFECPLGAGALTGTGFEDHAATGWLETAAPIDDPGTTITIELDVWDSKDGQLDTTGLFDNFRFEAEAASTETVPVPK